MGKQKKIIFSLFILLVSYLGYGQEEEKIFQKVELEAHTDVKKWNEHITKNSMIPDSVSKNIPAGTYKVLVQFIVDKHGNIGQVKAKDNPGYGLGEKAENVLKSYKGEWKPASQCGRLVNTYKVQPVVFVIN